MNPPDISKFPFRRDFEREEQTRLCAAAIEGIRLRLGSDWQKLSVPAADRNPQLRAARKLVKAVIRVAGESTDHQRTVDFITLAAARSIDAARLAHIKGESLAGHLSDTTYLSHEHMVPCETVLMALVEAPADTSLFEVLDPLTYRALVCKTTERPLLDSKPIKSGLPPLDITRLAKSVGKEAVAPAFKALLRYDVVGVLEHLIPISDRARKLLPAYLERAA